MNCEIGIRFLMSRGASLHDAEDIYQEAEVRRLKRGESEISFHYLAQQHTNYGRREKAVKRGGRADRHDIPDGGFTDPRPVDPDSRAILREDLGVLRTAVANLSPVHREIIELELEDLTPPEMAAKLGIPLGTVYSRRHRAIEALRSIMVQNIS